MRPAEFPSNCEEWNEEREKENGSPVESWCEGVCWGEADEEGKEEEGKEEKRKVTWTLHWEYVYKLTSSFLAISGGVESTICLGAVGQETKGKIFTKSGAP